MAQRGRKPKETTVATPVDYAKLLKQFEEEQKVQMETLYKDLAIIRKKVDLALTKIGFMDEVENVAQAAFKAGRAYGPLDEANDKLEEILENMYAESDLDHYDDIYDK